MRKRNKRIWRVRSAGMNVKSPADRLFFVKGFAQWRAVRGKTYNSC